MVGHRDRAEAGVARAGEQDLDRRGAVARVVGVHVQVDVDQLPLGQARAHGGLGVGVVAARRDLGVDRVEALRDAAPVVVVAVALGARAQPGEQAVVADEALELGGERVDVAGLEQQPEVVVAADDLLVGAAGARRPAPRPRRARARARRGRARRRARRRRGRRRRRAPRPPSCPASDSTCTRSSSCERTVGAAPEGTKTVASQSRSVGSRRSARRNSRSAARSSWSQNAIRTGPSCGGPLQRRGAGPQDAYSAGKIRCISSRVDSKEALRASSRPKNSSTKRRATWVESTRSAGAWNVPTLSEREWRSATDDALGANGSCTCTKSGGAPESASSIVREMSTGGAGIAPRRAPASGSSSPTPSTRTSPSGPNSSPARIMPPRVAHERGIVGRREHHDAVPGRGLLGRQRAHEGVDLVLVLPRVRGHLRDGEGRGHGRRKGSPGWAIGRMDEKSGGPLTLAVLILRKP